jgi:putative transposase
MEQHKNEQPILAAHFFVIDMCSMLDKLYFRRYPICLENLNVEGMMKNHKLAMAIQSASWSEFVRLLKYKAEWEGKNIVFIGRFEPSSKTCSKCGYVKSDLKLSDREWICPVCGEHHDRDVNAAVNIKKFALNPQALVAIEDKANEIE